jgi:hypothetical protein
MAYDAHPCAASSCCQNVQIEAELAAAYTRMIGGRALSRSRSAAVMPNVETLSFLLKTVHDVVTHTGGRFSNRRTCCWKV